MAKKKKPPSIKQLPSGNYNVQIVVGNDASGKRIVESFTDASYAAVMQWALDRRLTRDEEQTHLPGSGSMTFGDALDAYIESKSAVLSPATIRGYRVIQRNALESLMPMQLRKITQNDLQVAINKEALDHKPKTLRNYNALITSVFSTFRPDFHPHTTLPQKEKNEIEVPEEDEVKKLLTAAKGTRYYIPIILAACCGMRRSEICGLRWKDVNFKKNTIRIDSALVVDEENNYVEKGTKSYSGTRTIPMMPPVRAALEEALTDTTAPDDLLFKGSINTITNKFPNILAKAGVRHFRFQDLRHYVVSIMLYLNIPKKYIADYVGHKDEKMINEVYGHIMKDKKSTFTDLLSNYMSSLV
jgi:integrase